MDALDTLKRLGRTHQKLRDELDALRPQLAEAIRAAAAEGVRQVDIVKATGYTREVVRQIVDPDVRAKTNRDRRSG